MWPLNIVKIVGPYSCVGSMCSTLYFLYDQKLRNLTERVLYQQNTNISNNSHRNIPQRSATVLVYILIRPAVPGMVHHHEEAKVMMPDMTATITRRGYVVD